MRWSIILQHASTPYCMDGDTNDILRLSIIASAGSLFSSRSTTSTEFIMDAHAAATASAATHRSATANSTATGSITPPKAATTSVL